jgi:hypothetical protein
LFTKAQDLPCIFQQCWTFASAESGSSAQVGGICWPCLLVWF